MQNKTYLHYLGLALREQRKALGHTQEGFSDTFGLGRRYYGDLERGVENVSIETLERIAKGLETTPAQILVRAEALSQADSEET